MPVHLLFLASVFAVYRLSHLLLYEEGFLSIARYIRIIFGAEGKGGLPKDKYKGISEIFTCFYCNTVWTSIPFSVYLASNYYEIPIFILSLSAIAIIVNEKVG